MRPIKFRGKPVNSDEWVYGGYYQTTKGEPRIITVHEITGTVTDWDVQPETVGQSTGYCDKNGKEIFEGDIIVSDRYPFFDDGKPNYVALVEFDDMCFIAVFELHKDSNARGISIGMPTDSDTKNVGQHEVIGNVHDNSDILRP